MTAKGNRDADRPTQLHKEKCIALIQKQFSHAYATGDHERIEQEMSLLGSAPEPQFAILADDTAIVLGATKGEWVGRSPAKVARAQWRRWPGEPLQAIGAWSRR